jgi:hypothetical protein
MRIVLVGNDVDEGGVDGGRCKGVSVFEEVVIVVE